MDEEPGCAWTWLLGIVVVFVVPWWIGVAVIVTTVVGWVFDSP